MMMKRAGTTRLCRLSIGALCLLRFGGKVKSRSMACSTADCLRNLIWILATKFQTRSNRTSKEQGRHERRERSRVQRVLCRQLLGGGSRRRWEGRRTVWPQWAPAAVQVRRRITCSQFLNFFFNIAINFSLAQQWSWCPSRPLWKHGTSVQEEIWKWRPRQLVIRAHICTNLQRFTCTVGFDIGKRISANSWLYNKTESSVAFGFL